ncbi:MAG: hypothetical protein AAFR81_15740 [Chloroflexota bacterium]
MKLRSLFLTATMSIMLLLGGVVNAQDFDPCFGLSGDDCATINDASANGIGDAEAFTLNVFIDFAMDNIPDEVTSAIGFSMEGAIDIAVAPDSLVGFEMAGELTFAGTLNDEDPEPETLDIRLVEDIVYVSDGEEAFSVDVVQLLESDAIDAQLDGLGLGMDADPEDVAGELPVDIAQVFALLDILNLPGLLNYERAGDEFIFTVDLSALQALLEEENEDLLNTIVETAAEVEPTAAFIIPVIPSLISSGIIEVNQAVDTDLNIVTDISFDMDIEVSLGALTTGDASAPATTVFLDTDLGISNLDDIGAIEPIEGAEDITEELLSGLGAALPQ